MGLQRESSPDPVNTGAAQSAGFSELTGRPLRRVAGRRFERETQDAVNICFAQFAWRARPWFIEQTVEPLFDKALPPLAYGLDCEMQFSRRLSIGAASGAKQNQASA